MATYLTEKKPYEPEIAKLEGKSAIVTGGTTGIGRATALLLAKHGVKTVIFGRHEQELNDTLRDLGDTHGDFHGLIADSAYEDQLANVFRETRERYGGLDILINNAALPGGSILETSYEQTLYMLRVNILGYLACIREAVGMMKERGGGHIVNVGSMSAKVREIGSDVYVATKAAIEGFSESLRKQLGQENIRISLIEPGSVGTNLSSEPPDLEKQVNQEAEGQSLEAEDIAHAIYYTLTQPPRSNIYELRIGPTKQQI